MPGVTKAPNPRLEAVYDIIIDESGHFKYVLCKVHDPVDPHEFKYIVRGSVTADFHCKFHHEIICHFNLVYKILTRFFQIYQSSALILSFYLPDYEQLNVDCKISPEKLLVS